MVILALVLLIFPSGSRSRKGIPPEVSVEGPVGPGVTFVLCFAIGVGRCDGGGIYNSTPTTDVICQSSGAWLGSPKDPPNNPQLPLNILTRHLLKVEIQSSLF